MKKIEKYIFYNFIKSKSEKIYIHHINNLLKKEIGFKLLTFTVLHPNKNLVQRIYSSNLKIYPIGGIKKIPRNKWAELTIKKQKSFIGNNTKQIKKYFFDHKVITSLGCESILNQVVVCEKKTIGTINLLNVENYFYKKDLSKTTLIAKFLTPIYLSHQLKMNKI